MVFIHPFVKADVHEDTSKQRTDHAAPDARGRLCGVPVSLPMCWPFSFTIPDLSHFLVYNPALRNREIFVECVRDSQI